MLIDTHCHLSYDPLRADVDAVLQRARAAGVRHMINIGTRADNFAAVTALAAQYPDVSASIGLHPEHADDFNENYCRIFQQYLPQAQAVGETGLDYFHESSPDPRVQQESFAYHLTSAGERGLTTVVHCRNAVHDTAAVLKKHAGSKVVIHCFTGSPEEARIFLDLGAYISFSGIVTFKNAADVHASAAYVPEDRILVETDAPFLAPMPHRGKPCEPAYVRHTAERIAQLRGTSAEELIRITGKNAVTAFGLPIDTSEEKPISI